jgi:hypothetical protein
VREHLNFYILHLRTYGGIALDDVVLRSAAHSYSAGSAMKEDRRGMVDLVAGQRSGMDCRHRYCPGRHLGPFEFRTCAAVCALRP